MSEGRSLQEGASAACLEAVPEVLETMFFELLSETPRIDFPPAGTLDTARVDFEGSSRGHLVVAVPPSLSRSLAAAFLAIEEQGARADKIEFVLGELANMLCGSALGRFQPDGSFRLSMLAAHLGRTLDGMGPPSFQWIRFSLDGGPIFVGLSLGGAE